MLQVYYINVIKSREQTKNNIFYASMLSSWINKDPLSCVNLKENGFKNCNLTLKAVIE